VDVVGGIRRIWASLKLRKLFLTRKKNLRQNSTRKVWGKEWESLKVREDFNQLITKGRVLGRNVSNSKK